MIDRIIDAHTTTTAVVHRLAELAYCCAGAAEYGPHRCTCWEPVFADNTPAQTEPQPGVVHIRDTPCVDCAFRPGSPERTGDPDYAHNDEGDLDALVVNGDLFWCHQGMRAPIAWRHPSGITVDVPPSGYQPPIVVDEDTRQPVPYKLDGTPADVCAGWAARRLHHVARDVIQDAADA